MPIFSFWKIISFTHAHNVYESECEVSMCGVALKRIRRYKCLSKANKLFLPIIQFAPVERTHSDLFLIDFRVR